MCFYFEAENKYLNFFFFYKNCNKRISKSIFEVQKYNKNYLREI